MMHRLYGLLFCLSLTLGAHAQEVEWQRYVFQLQDGSRLQGELVTLTADSVALRIIGGQVVRLERSAVTDFYPEGEKPAERQPPKRRSYEFEEKGFFHVLAFGTHFTRDEFGGTEAGLGLYYTFGYQWNRWIGLGLGTGLDAYTLYRGYQVVPLNLHYRSFLTRSRIAPMVLLDAGYGFALRNESYGIVEARGGWMVHPAVGVRFGAHPKVNFAMDVGYRFQKASFTEDLFFPWGPGAELEQRNLLFQRLTFRINLLF